MDSPRLSFDEESQPSTQSIKDPSLRKFCYQVLLFLIAFIIIALLALGIIYFLHDKIKYKCPVNSTNPFEHELFLRNASMRG